MPATEEKDSSTSCLDDTLKSLKNLKISERAENEFGASRKRSQSCTIFTVLNSLSSTPSTSSTRFRPYVLPKSSRSAGNTQSILKPRSKAVIPDDVEDSKSSKSASDVTNSSSDNVKKYQSCSQQASSSVEDVSKELNCEIDELSEYFAHFVNVNVKISPLVESIYT